ncbi:PepSY domain-containing protein (plasmid) [Arthrobacter sp. TES]|uniref:PepSY domain-containing protein n=1 Tax=Paenarthrobacter ureafaciens TaxID=37931 RepID=UPI000A79FDD0|nr:PepSY domain-containing protein [Paenarthrobacter ureafaciens]QOI65574.1 PepSY domain-containing protein [Arthrobacter sp. TES]GLU61074.1 peptidase [Paenarthrobacter ureafaciens]GLU65343.1 peptidase [Paenarthrobacter ureafaciens]GLU69730.1 peptidase [Paenarthrobacter ureafaciens]GLU73953.1 peptidase [Paenarthrobacter ureafaciens]
MDNTSRKRKTLIGALAGLALIGGTAVVGLSAANASTTPSPPATSPATGSTTDGEKSDGGQQEPQLKGSITVPETTGEQSDAQESANLAAVATIDAKAAETAAAASLPGSAATASHLGDENGSLVYDVTVKDSTGAVHEVKIDAGNATVLANETADPQENGQKGTENTTDTESNETPDASSPGTK